jgi:PIN domain nuclease of toxin-antitoxin system
VRLLLDTHTLIWWMESSPRLSEAAAIAIGAREDDIFVSAATAWEMATKYRLGKLQVNPQLMESFPSELAEVHFYELPVRVGHGLLAGSLLGEHKDPFDRMLIAQALEEDMTLVSNEAAFDRFGVKRLW